jgi:hypothetical protein
MISPYNDGGSGHGFVHDVLNILINKLFSYLYFL